MKTSLANWLEITARGTSGDQVHDILYSWVDANAALQARIDALEAENARFASLLRDVKEQLDIATDLSNKRWEALNDIYINAEKHNVNWCKRRAAAYFTGGNNGG